MVTKVIIEPPADIPEQMHNTYIQHYKKITNNTGRLMLFSADQKIEHLNYDFYGLNIPPEVANPEHIFKIASQGSTGALATHLGLVARYGKRYKNINYLIKLNGKTNLIPLKQSDPLSARLYTVEDVINFKEVSGLAICAVGATVYLGSEYEQEMLEFASQMIYQAHMHGLVSLLWMYPRGKAVSDEDDPLLIAGAAGVANALGSDFVKIKPPKSTGEKNSAQWLKVIVQAAGNTKVICSGGKQKKPKEFLQTLYDQLHIGGTSGNATGRNIFQYDDNRAIAMTHAIAALVFDNKTVEEALLFIQG